MLEREVESLGLADLIFELCLSDLGTQARILLLALNGGPAAPPTAEEVDTILALTRATVLLKIGFRAPDLTPKVEAKRLEIVRAVGRRKDLGMGAQRKSLFGGKADPGIMPHSFNGMAPKRNYQKIFTPNVLMSESVLTRGRSSSQL